jgi:hypothetical protein
MQCPICGETLPLSSKVCEACGNEYDGFFLTEEFDSSDVRKRVTSEAARRKQPSALKPGRPPLDPKIIWIVAGVVVAVAVIGALLYFFMPQSGGAPSKPEATVSKYYDYIKSGDAEGLFSLFEPGFLPTAPDRAAIQAALSANSYAVKGPQVTVLKKDKATAVVEIEGVEVDVTPKAGGPVKKLTLVDANGAPMVSVVELSNNGNGWKIMGRPVNGWSPDNLWLLGDVKTQ